MWAKIYCMSGQGSVGREKSNCKSSFMKCLQKCLVVLTNIYSTCNKKKLEKKVCPAYLFIQLLEALFHSIPN